MSTPSPPADDDHLIGTTLDGRYQIEARIGRGGMGDVYRGTHLMMGQTVAVKVLRPDLARDETAAKRFAREARGVFAMDHANCVRVFDFAYDAQVRVMYLVMEYLDGRTVGDELHVDGPMAATRVAHVGAQIAAVLEQAHAAGLIHRDLKPDNVMLLRRGDDADFAKVLDFGLAKLYEPDSAGTTMFSMAALTQEGTVFGTPEYMSPEQATGQDLDPRSDVYSLGAVLYEMLTGLLPLHGATFMATLTKHVREVPVAPARRRPELGIPPTLDALVMRCLAKRPADRPRDATALRTELAVIGSQLATRASRLPQALAASETMDLGQSAEKLGLRSAVEAEVECMATGSTDRPTDTFGTELRRARSRRRALAGAAAVGFVAAIAVLATRRGDGDPAPAARPIATAAAPLADAAPAAVHAPSDATVDAAVNDAAPVDTAPREGPKRPTRDPHAREIAEHFTEAAAARASGNRLREIAALDAILHLDRRNRRALYELGQALVRAGDKGRGCGYLKRAGSYRDASKRLADAGCPTSSPD